MTEGKGFNILVFYILISIQIPSSMKKCNLVPEAHCRIWGGLDVSNITHASEEIVSTV